MKFWLLLLLVVVALALEDNIIVTGNTHCVGNVMSSCSAANLMPSALMTSSPPLQPDTSLGVVHKKVLGFPVPVYLFKQPARLSHLELPFKLLLVRDITLDGIEEINVPAQKASDSWFMGYSWSIIVCHGGRENTDGGVSHLGWKFQNGADSFYALIVDWAESADVTAGQSSETEALTIGVPAPSWILALAAGATITRG
jgi:hypothetical protein